MSRTFNTAGMCRADHDYMLPPLRRLPLVRSFIDQQKYFVLHAPRQVGKSTALLSLAQTLTRESRFAAILVSMETGAPESDDVGLAEDAILTDWREDIRDQLPPELHPPAWPAAPPQMRIGAALASWARSCPRPLVVFLDEIDALRDRVLISVLRQLRSGFRRRPEAFPWSLALCGLRDVRDYKLLSGGKDRLRSPSPFNIKVESLTLRNFTPDEVGELYAQHTEDTGQRFLPDALARAFELSGGHPWLVNALGRQVTQVEVPDPGQPVARENIDAAKDALILRRDTHLDSLMDTLYEERVRRIIEPILIGKEIAMDTLSDDLLYVRDLGLVAPTAPVRIANPIYTEIVPRALCFLMQEQILADRAFYLRDDGGLDMLLLLAAFQEFFAEHSEAWLRHIAYREAGPHLLLMAYLQRVVNGGGRISRELAAGAGRADLVVEFAGRRSVIELKIRTGPDTEAQGIEQLCHYLDRLGEPAGYLVLFDRRKSVPWADRIYQREAAGPAGQRIHVIGA